jgi:hypothetical protein
VLADLLLLIITLLDELIKPPLSTRLPVAVMLPPRFKLPLAPIPPDTITAPVVVAEEAELLLAA